MMCHMPLSRAWFLKQHHGRNWRYFCKSRGSGVSHRLGLVRMLQLWCILTIGPEWVLSGMGRKLGVYHHSGDATKCTV
jgi:hypothetical protein